MKKALPILVLAVVLLAAVAGTLLVVRSLNLRPRPMPVLMYHGIADDPGKDIWTVSTDEFRRQLEALREAGYRSVLPRQLRRARQGLFLLPDKPVILTFDDGFRSNLELAEPLLATNGFQAICYLIVGSIADDEGHRATYRGYPHLIWPEVEAMAARGTFDFGIHSISHTPDPVRQSSEVASARISLSHHLGRRPRDYCYPFGQSHPLIHSALAREKFRTAMICEDLLFTWEEDASLFHIPRISIYGGTHRFSVDSAEFRDGVFSAQVANDGPAIPVLGILRDSASGATWEYRPTRRVDATPQTWRWEGLPGNLDPAALRVEIWEQNGLFPYRR